MVAPFGDTPELVAQSPSGASIAVFATGDGPRAPVLLVHGTATDHTTWRMVAPLLGASRRVYALDRAGRGASSGSGGGAVGECEDVAAAADAVAAREGRSIAVVGHSLGGRLALAAALRAPAIRRVVAYEGAPTTRTARDLQAEDSLATLYASGMHDASYALFLRDIAGLSEAEVAAARESEVWASRVALVPTILSDIASAHESPALGLETLARVTCPVLQLAGTTSPARFRDGVLELDRRLSDGRVEFVEGARHNAHHSHPEAFVAAVIGFLDA